ncbi:MAG: phosphatidylserine decarboxylase [Pirellulales bacterium]|nr:phosphatidylserine decarboxylase [Pirellulales bacterium]
MTEVQVESRRLEPRPLPDNIRGVQPGGGFFMQVELAWGRVRRWYLRTFRKHYVGRMADCRIGETIGAPHEIVDPRDLKFCKNLCECSWAASDDPFAWRERVPFARWGLVELFLMGGALFAATIALAWLGSPWHFGAIVTGVAGAVIVYFFRDPNRQTPTDPNLLISPADGKVVEITRLEHSEFIDGPAVRIGIFLSLFNVHINRAPSRSRVIEMRYSPGLFLNAMNPESAIRNENMWIGLEEDAEPHRRLIVRQISGLVARRICCELKPGDTIESGEKFGMIKLGSRTELIMPDTDDMEIAIAMGQSVKAGTTIMARYSS